MRLAFTLLPKSTFAIGRWRTYMHTPFTYRGWRIVYASSTMFLDTDALWQGYSRQVALSSN